MSWHGIEGHDDIVQQFRQAIQSDRLASTFLFVGPPGVGKRAFAQQLAQVFLCQQQSPRDLDPCQTCPACQQVRAGSHPDVELVAKPANKSAIPVELFIGDREHRMREGLCHRIALKPSSGKRRVAIIDDADHLNQEGANCLLKTLEEPPPGAVLILIGTSRQRQLPTIRSRCQIVRFRPLPDDVLARLLVEHEIATTAAEASRLTVLAAGSLQRAAELAQTGLLDFRSELLPILGSARWDGLALAKTIGSYVDQAGKEAAMRRDRLRLVIGQAIEFYRQLLRQQTGAAPSGDDDLTRIVADAATQWPGDVETTAACLDRCLEALAQVDANANQATLIECWLDDLLLATGYAAPCT